jgi:hypothetical protein
MATPLFLLALFWDRLDPRNNRWLRGREISVGRLRLHSTSLVSGAMFILLGTLFIAYEGTSALSGLYESNGATDLAFAAERLAEEVARRVPGTALLLALAAVVAALPVLHRWRGRANGKANKSEAYPAKRCPAKRDA